MFDVSQPDSAWSAEGLTVYTTYRIIKDLYGDAYAKEHYIDQWQTAVDDYYNNFYIRNPQYLEHCQKKNVWTFPTSSLPCGTTMKCL